MLKVLFGACIIFSALQYTHGVDEKIEFCNINVKKAIQSVSDKFLSISIDPAVLLAGVNLSETSLRLAQHLSPAYIRIAGASTSFVRYVDKEEKPGNYLSEDGNNVVVTPSMWFGINEWLKLTKLMPVFGINDVDTASGMWNPKATLPLFEISDKLNVSCYWQLGFDSTNKTSLRYEQDLSILHYILAAFPERNETWKVVGSDLSRIPVDDTEKTIEELKETITAVMWEPSHVTEDSFPEKDMAYKILQKNSKPEVKMWTTVPKTSETVTFSSALLWAAQIGNAAKTGYDVVFRQPRIYELFSDTPVYWFSLLHKKLMGSNVLEAKSTASSAGAEIYAHCTRKQNSFVRRGAMTVMMVNNNTETYRVKVKLGSAPPEKSMEVQTYILTSPALNSTDILLNGKLLTPKTLQEETQFEPKIRRAKTSSHISLSVPPYSVGFFVLPGARVPVCIEQENEIELLLEEMEKNQNIPLSEEVALKFGTRASFVKNHILDELTQQMKQEMKSDEKYYKDRSLKSMLDDLREKHKEHVTAGKIDDRGRKFFIDRVKFTEKHKKHADFEKKREELKKFLTERSRLSKAEPKVESKIKELDLSSDEVEKILRDRARARAARRNIVFTDEELKALIHKASKKFYKSKIKRSIPTESRAERDINMRLLDQAVQLEPSSAKPSDKKNRERELSENVFKRSVRKPRDLNMKLSDYKAKVAERMSLWQDKKDELLGNTQMAKENIRDRIRTLKYKNRFRRDINKDLRKPRDINMKLTDYKAKVSERISKWQDKKDELLGNTQMAKENIRDKLNTLKHKNRFRRDINMDLLDIKSKGGKKAMSEKKSPKNKHVKEATMRKAGQTSDELLEELALQDKESEEPTPAPKTEVFAELADSEDLEEDELFRPTPKPKKLRLFDKKPKIDPFGIANPSIEVVDPPFRKSKKGKKKSKSHDELQFLTTSEEFTDIEDDLPCIHEFFGPDSKSERSKKQKKVIAELGELFSEEQPKKKKKSKSKKKTSESEESVEDLSRRKRDLYPPSDSTDFANKLDHLESQLNDLESKYKECNKKLNNLTPNAKQPEESILETEQADVKKVISGTPEDTDSITRTKRANELSTGDGPAQITKDASEDYRKDLANHLKVLRHMLEADKLKFEEEKRRNKLKLLQMKKKQELALANKAEEVVSRIQRNETETGNHLLKNLKELKEELQHRKDELDKWIMRDLEVGKQLKENTKEESPAKPKRSDDSANLSKGIHEAGAKPEDSFAKPSPDLEHNEKQRKDTIAPKTKSEKAGHAKDFKKHEPNSYVVPVGLVNNDKKPPAAANVVKRSIFDTNTIFGNYHPMTPELRMWKPSDILSLQTGFSPMMTNNLMPPNDLHIFKNIFDQNRLFGLRKRRSIDASMSDLENAIDSDFNEIMKESEYLQPKLSLDNKEYKLVLPNEDEFEISKKDGVTEMKFLHHDGSEQPMVTEDSLVSMIFKDDFSDEVKKKGEEKVVDLDKNKDGSDQLEKNETPKDIQDVEDLLDLTIFGDYPSEEKSEKAGTEKETADTLDRDQKKKELSEELKLAYDLEGNLKNRTNYHETSLGDNIQRISSDKEKMIFQDLISNFRNFFANIGKKIEQYMKQMIS